MSGKRRSGVTGEHRPLISLRRLKLPWWALALLLVAMAAGAVITLFVRPAEGQVTRVIDGDTIDVFHAGQEVRVRLLGIDTPEINHPERGEEPFGREASTFTRSKLLGKQIFLRVDPVADDHDIYGRLLRYVELEDGTDFSAELVRGGYARAMRSFSCSRKDLYIALEREAQRERRGMWRDSP